jgi:dCTP deaminase
MIKNDTWISQMAAQGMIEPFEPTLVRRTEAGNSVISFRHVPGTVVDPKNFNPANLEPAELHTDETGEFFILPAHSYGLGVAMERLAVPNDVTVVCIGKSTYARIGIIANLTPAEAGWKGHLTLEFSNSSSADCRIYAGEGIVQLLFLGGEPCAVSYEDRKGKYQDQTEQVTLARI